MNGISSDKEKALLWPQGFLPDEFQRPTLNNGGDSANSKKRLQNIL